MPFQFALVVLNGKGGHAEMGATFASRVLGDAKCKAEYLPCALLFILGRWADAALWS